MNLKKLAVWSVIKNSSGMFTSSCLHPWKSVFGHESAPCVNSIFVDGFLPLFEDGVDDELFK